MKRDNFNHGFPDEIWNAAKKEARDAMIEVAGRQDTMSYSDLSNHLERTTGLYLEPHDFRFHHMLGEISTAEDAAGRGLLTAVVVHKEDRKPGRGFFELAQRRGRDTSEELRFLGVELKKVYAAWSRRAGSS